MGTAYNPRAVTDGLILSLDAANPKSYSGSGTTWRDLSGSGHHATFANLATYNQTYFSFDGIANYATIDANLKTVINNSSELTLTVLVNYKFFEHVDNIVGWGNANTSGSPLTSRTLGFYNHSNTLRPTYGSGASFGTSSTIANRWLFLVSRYDNTTIYGDVFGSTRSISSAAIADPFTWKDINPTWDITIGKTSYFARYAECDISLVQGYNRKLTDEEIEQNFNACRGRFGI